MKYPFIFFILLFVVINQCLVAQADTTDTINETLPQKEVDTLAQNEDTMIQDQNITDSSVSKQSQIEAKKERVGSYVPKRFSSLSVDPETKKKKRRVKRKVFSKPWRAAITSMIVPGLGQILYAKRGYIRGPIYLGLFIYFGLITLQSWNDFRDASFGYNAYQKISLYKDSTDFFSISQRFQGFTEETFDVRRRQFRRELDQNFLYLLLSYIVQMLDAAVFTHLRDFNVSNNLSMGIEFATPNVNNFGNPYSVLQPQITLKYHKSPKYKRINPKLHYTYDF